MHQEPLNSLKTMYMGALAGDGGFGTALTIVDNAVIDTPVMTTAEGSTTDFNIEQSDFPFFSRKIPGTTTFTASLYGVSAQELQRHFGGTLTPGATSGDADKWDAPDSFQAVERTIVLQQEYGYVRINRGLVTATLEWNFKKNDLPKINISVAVLKPTKNGVPPLTFMQGTYVP